MAIPKFATVENGEVVLKDVGVNASAGAADADKAVVTGADGKVDLTLLPDGIGDDAVLYPASENLSAGNLVNVWDDAGTFKVRKADATTNGKPCHGFVKGAATSGTQVKVFFDGSITGVSGVTAGDLFLSTTAGGFTATPPATTGNIVQKIGFGMNATTISFEAGMTVKLA